MKLTRQQMAGIAFALLLAAVVVLYLVGGDSAHDVAERLEGAMGLALAAFLGETVVRGTRGSGATGLVLLAALALGAHATGCGGSSAEQVPDVVKRAAARCVEAVIEELNDSGGEVPAVAPAPPIERQYQDDAARTPQEDITMPTIVKRGSDPREAKYRLACSTCGTVALFEPFEVESDQREADSWVTCPVCKRPASLRARSVTRVSAQKAQAEVDAGEARRNPGALRT